MINQETFNRANDVLRTIQPDYRFDVRGGRLWFATRYGSRAVVTANGGLTLGFRYGRLGLGGTEAAAVAQLARWIRGQTRRPIQWWMYCYKQGLGKIKTVGILLRNGYADAKTSCVLCGNATEQWDWWSLDGVTGPCCSFGKCQRRQN